MKPSEVKREVIAGCDRDEEVRLIGYLNEKCLMSLGMTYVNEFEYGDVHVSIAG